jgi:GNAT superfamily N-acetyltransferase
VVVPDPVVELVAATETLELRRRVLGRASDDTDPRSAHAVVRLDGAVVATGTLRREGDGWQLRGMAVEPAMRGNGLGTAVLHALLTHVRGRGAVWCHARIAAASLYERAGFVRDGEPFDDPVAGTQVRMVLFNQSVDNGDRST